MVKYCGKSVNQGIAIGKIKLYQKKEYTITQKHDCDANQEIYYFENAKILAKKQLKELCQNALETVGKDSTSIFEMHEIMMDDLDYTDFIYRIIRAEKVSAEYAVSAAGNQFSSVFSAMEDEYMRERASDIRDITERLISCLKNSGDKGFELDEPAIILAEDLTPSETIQLDRNKILGFVTLHGSANSHTAILARMMNIPALVSTNIQLTNELDHRNAIINGNNGELIIDPEAAVLSDMRKFLLAEEQKTESLRTYIGKDSVTMAGKRINIFANIGNVTDLESVMQNDADGIGLFRSEFLFLGRDNYPTEEEQFQAYKQVAETMADKKVIIRTLDIGADKHVPYFNLDREENPAMGYRAIRICLTRQEIFRTQLRAIYRASAFGNIAIMYPMIISVSEVKQIKTIIDEIKFELKKEKIDFKEMEQGVMIETPASVMVSDDLAKEVDFFSIGTNDLAQYTLAIDRQNDKLDAFYDRRHPAVLKMIQMVIENGHKENCWVGICGELGADTTLTQTFIKMGIDELSVSPAFVLPIREIVCNT
ncbi:MAG: phosphoenolpyruvate--protein phosphotransferase [Bacillota bacterium]